MKGIIKQVLLATCVIGAPTCVYALPFNPNPQSFQSYMNTRSWKTNTIKLGFTFTKEKEGNSVVWRISR